MEGRNEIAEDGFFFFCGCRSRLAPGVIREANTNDDFARLISLGC